MNDVDARRISVTRRGDVIRVIIYSSFSMNRGDADKYFDMSCPVNDKKKLKALFDAVRSKGLLIPD